MLLSGFFLQLEAATAKLKDFEQHAVYVTKEDFWGLAMFVVRPSIKYYDNHFNVPGSALQNVMKGAIAARVFDPRVLANQSKQTCLHLIDEVFEYLANPDFDDGLRTRLKADLSAVRKTAQDADFSLATVAGAVEYDAALAAAAARRARDGNDGDRVLPGSAREPPPPKTWEDDLKESARRIMVWWKAAHNAGRFLPWTKAVRIVALVQMSSTFVERVYSQAKLVRESCGDVMLRDNYETRLMVLVNKNVPVTVSGLHH